MKRRSLSAIAAAAVVAVVAHAADQPPTGAFSREAMLKDIVQKVLVPGYDELNASCRELSNAVGQLTSRTDLPSFENARQAWRATSQAAARMRCFQKGPIADRDYTSTFFYWQILPARVDAVLASTRTIDSQFIDELGSTAKGLFAIEYVLFVPSGGSTNAPAALSALSGKEGERRRNYLIALARDIQTKAAQLADDWKATGDQSAAAKFVKAGQESVNLLVNQLTLSIEKVADRHLNFVLLLPKPVAAQLDRIEWGRSGSSLEGVIASIEGTRKLYLGGDGLGLDDALKQMNAAWEKRLDTQFEAALTSARAIAMPIENAASDNRPAIQTAYEKTHALEVMFKVDVASALGVTITFSSADGD